MYDVSEPNSCKEEDALEVTEKERANFCDYFNPNPKAYTPGFVESQDKALSELTALFSNSGETDKENVSLDESSDTPENDVLSRAEDLFK